MGGDISSLSPTAAASVEKAALGAVSESEIIRFGVLPSPVFRKPKDIWTVSPGSTALFVGEQASATRRDDSRTTTGSLFTTTVKLLVALKGGDPSSVTIVRKRLVLFSWAIMGVQVMTPLGAIEAPAGPASVYVSELAGRSESV